MYSIVMLSAMSAGADVTPPPAAVPHAVAPVAYGCCGAMPIGCYGSSCYGSSCHGYSCHGSACHGSSCHGGFLGMRSGGLLGRHHSCHGSCYGSSCYGSSCHGCSGYACFGSCYGYGSAGAVSYGSSWGPPVGMPPYTLHGYNSGVEPVYGPGFPVVLGSNYTDPHAVYGNTFSPNRAPVVTIPVAPVAPMTKPGSDAPMGANLKFTVPASTKLFVDGKPVAGTGTDRAFYTPPLAAGQKFFYDVKAELVVGGKVVVEEKRVIVEAGANLTETFPKLVAALNGATNVAGK